MPRQCLRDGVKSRDFIGFLGWKRRIYTSFTPLEDGSVVKVCGSYKRYEVSIFDKLISSELG